MERLDIVPRPDWPQRIEALGFDFNALDGIAYWHEAACYRFSAAEIDEIEAAANTLHGLCLAAVDRIVSDGRYGGFGISPAQQALIQSSWNARRPSVYGRFDLIYDGHSPPKLLEYNADTPTSLFEAAIVQWYWKEEVFPGSDQFNSLHEALVERWRVLRGQGALDEPVYVTCATPNPEDETTVQYLGATAIEAGCRSKFVPIEVIGWDPARRIFVDLDGLPMRSIFKLYPWEWLTREEFGGHIAYAGVNFIEPAWKMLLSNKAILAVLWEMFPGHENLLPAFLDPAPLGDRPSVRKPLLGREGANVAIWDGAQVTAETAGPYVDSGYVYQAFAPLPAFGGVRCNIGAWIVGDTCHGMGMREDDGLIMGNSSRFVPHIFD
jgi:glutathionylspermidine synthase